MDIRILLPDPSCLHLEHIRCTTDRITLVVTSVQSQVRCPLCCQTSQRIHSRYTRTLADLPWSRVAVSLRLHVRKYFCDNPACSRVIFTEPLPSVAARYARKTQRLAAVLEELTWLLGGEGAARVARLIGLTVSPEGLLERLRKRTAHQTARATPRVLGIDDFAFRKGFRYGTLLVDLERGQPIDLLPDREGASVEKWLREHPGIEVISRDRAMAYAEAVRQAAPQALVVADRFHLLKNLMEALEKQVAREYAHVQQILAPQRPAAQGERAPPPARTWQERRSQQSRQKRLACWQQVQELAQQGLTQEQIAQQTGVEVHTVRRYLRASTFPERRPHACPPGKLTAYQAYLLRRWQEGCHNALQLWRELQEQGFTGGATIVRNYVRAWREPGTDPAVQQARRTLPSVRSLTWLLVLEKRRTPEQTQMIQTLLQASSSLRQSLELVQAFRSLLQRRALDELEGWLQKAQSSGLTDLAVFARGILPDRAAVEAAVCESWSNGATEGQVNRLKFIKRQGYGRASFELLKARVLPLSA